MFKLPKTVRVGPYVYTFEQNRIPDADRRWAETSHMARTIRFGELCNPAEMPSTLIHELIHAVEAAYAVDLKEEQVLALANGLTQALTDLGLLPEEMELGG